MELFQSIAEAISLYRYIFWPLLALVILTIVFIRWWNQVSYFFLNFFSGLPVIGLVARLSRSNEPRRAEADGKSWYPAEKMLCAKYWRYYESFNHSASFYHQCVNYLNKVDERGRKPTGPLLWFCSVALVLLEAFIFALVLSPFIANNISANQAEFSAIVISILIGVVLVPATHLMGAELHKNTLLKKIRYWYTDARHDGNAKGLAKANNVSLENSDVDDDQPNYIQMRNRVNTNVEARPQYWATVIALALIIFFAVGAYFVRAATIDAIDTQTVNGSPFSQMSETQGSPFELPAEAAADNAKADSQASDEINHNRVFASKLTFIILSVIFVGVQLIGILIGIYRSFAGIESKMAAKYVGNFSGSEEFTAWHSARRERVERDAQEKLSALQNRMLMKRTSSQSQQLNELPTFDDYVNKKIRDKASAAHELNQRHHAESDRAHAEPVVQPTPAAPAQAAEPLATPAAPTPVVQPTPAAPAPVAEPLVQATPVASQDEKARLDALGELTGLSEEELALVADDQGLSLEALLKRQRVQQLLNRTRAKGEA